MSDLYTEALKDIKKLHEVAEQDAKNAIVEALTPYIRQMIAKEAANPTDFFLEQDEELDNEEELQQDPAAQPVQQAAPATPTPTAPAPQPAAPAPAPAPADLGDTQTVAPLNPESEEMVGTTMPDEEGKVTVDFEDLFIDDGSITMSKDQADKLTPVQVQGEPGLTAPAAEPATADATAPGLDAQATPSPEAPLEPAGEEDELLDLPMESISYKDYAAVYGNISEKIDRVYFSRKVTDIAKESLKQRLFDLLETVDMFREKGILSPKQAKLQENKLEFLFLKLKEAGLHNSYNMNIQDKDTDMRSLKEFAAKLFEEDQNLAKDSVSTGDTGLSVDTEYSKHAANVSGVDPKLGSRKDIEVGKATVDAGTPSWEDGEPEKDEEDSTMKENSPDANPDANDDVAEGAEGFGDSDEDCDDDLMESLVYEIDSAEIAETVRNIRKESIRNKMQKLAEASDGKEAKSWEDGEPEGGEDDALDNLSESMEGDELSEMLDEDAELEDAGDLVLNIDLPPEVEEELAKLGLEDEDFNVDLELNFGGDEAGDDLADLDGVGDDAEVEVVDDEGEGLGSEEEDMVLVDGDDSDLRTESAKRKVKLLEKKLANLAKLLEEKETQVNTLQGQLVETNLFTAKAVYYSKFLQRALTEKSLNKKALQQIVEHLDKGKTVAETKAIFNKIERKLNEHVTASRKLDGSSSKVTKPGSANLNEGAVPQAGRNPNAQTSERWRELAGISKKA